MNIITAATAALNIHPDHVDAYLDAQFDAERERMDALTAAPWSLDGAHSEWHAIHGADSVCPLDCGIGEAEASSYDDVAPTIRCGHCKDYHHTTDDVRACSIASRR